MSELQQRLLLVLVGNLSLLVGGVGGLLIVNGIAKARRWFRRRTVLRKDLSEWTIDDVIELI
jgi:hypothetical protein